MFFDYSGAGDFFWILEKYNYKQEILFSVKLKAIANDANSELHFSPPELLLDVPFNMGCYQGEFDNADTVDTFTDKSPASCIVGCALKDQEYRFAG